MNLVKERLSWRRDFEDGFHPKWPAFEEYKKKRLSESWRGSKVSEKFYEYVLWLEEQHG